MTTITRHNLGATAQPDHFAPSCPPWCEQTASTHDSEHTINNVCQSEHREVPVCHDEPQLYGGGRWLIPWLNVFLNREHEEDAGVTVCIYDEVLQVTLHRVQRVGGPTDLDLSLREHLLT